MTSGQKKKWRRVYKGQEIYVIDDRLALVLLNSPKGEDSYRRRAYRPFGLFIVPNSDGSFCAIDNSGGDAWTEDFHNEKCAFKWLVGEYEDYHSYLLHNRWNPDFIRLLGRYRPDSSYGWGFAEKEVVP